VNACIYEVYTHRVKNVQNYHLKNVILQRHHQQHVLHQKGRSVHQCSLCGPDLDPKHHFCFLLFILLGKLIATKQPGAKNRLREASLTQKQLVDNSSWKFVLHTDPNPQLQRYQH
jgi:hypothetical protein